MPQKHVKPRPATPLDQPPNRRPDLVRTAISITLGLVVLLVPLALSTAMVNVYTTPKFVVLLVGGAVLAPLLAFHLLERPALLRSPFVLALGALIVTIGISTLASADPELALLGTFTSRMGLITYIAFACCAVAVLAVAGNSPARFGRLFVWQTLAGSAVAIVCVLQITGIVSIYPAGFSLGEAVPRVHGTVGHPDYAGNYLLYTVFPALAIAYGAKGPVRAFGIATSAMAFLAILYTGTRGAWVGFLAGSAAGLVFAWRAGLVKELSRKTKLSFAGLAALVLVTGIVLLATAEQAAPIRARLAAFAAEGFTGAGRTGVWLFTLGLLPRFWLSGCGPDLFKLAQTPYKTLEYVQATGGVNIEDPHNAYLSMWLGSGIFALAAYLTLIVLAVKDLPKAILKARSREEAAIGICLLASLAAGLTHDLFLHHLSVNGLAFFLFLALGHVWSRLPESDTRPASDPGTSFAVRTAAALVVGTLIPFAFLHAWRVSSADAGIARTLRAAGARDERSVTASGNRAVSHGLPQPDYHFYYAVALEQLARANTVAGDRQRLFRAAADEASKAVAQPLPPVPYVAYVAALSVQTGRIDDARAAIERARQMDPCSYHAELSALQLHVAEGNIDEAILRYERVELMNSPYDEIAKARILLRDAIQANGNVRTEAQQLFLERVFQREGKRRSR